MTKFMVELDLHDARALFDCVGAGSIEGQITPNQCQRLKDKVRDVIANLEDRGNCPECRGNGQLQGDYRQDWNCQTCEANGIPSFINREHRT